MDLSDKMGSLNDHVAACSRDQLNHYTDLFGICSPCSSFGQSKGHLDTFRVSTDTGHRATPRESLTMEMGLMLKKLWLKI